MKQTKNRIRMVLVLVCTVGSTPLSAYESISAQEDTPPAKSGTAMADSTHEQNVNFELRDGQSGFAGVTGTIWRIAADGAVTITTFLNERESPTTRTGKLDTAIVKRLNAQFHAAHFETLPESLGSAPPINPRTLSLKYGTKTVTLTLPPTDPEKPEPASENAQERQFIELVKKLRDEAEKSSR